MLLTLLPLTMLGLCSDTKTTESFIWSLGSGLIQTMMLRQAIGVA